MQPHSMCAVALSNYIWYANGQAGVDYRVTVEFRRHDGTYRNLKYRCTPSLSTDKSRLDIFIIRDGGGIACTITLDKRGAEGSEVSSSHSQQHVSGLREVYNLYKGKVKNGMHYNSLMYKGFEGELITQADPKKMTMKTEVKVTQDRYATINYLIIID